MSHIAGYLLVLTLLGFVGLLSFACGSSWRERTARTLFVALSTVFFLRAPVAWNGWLPHIKDTPTAEQVIDGLEPSLILYGHTIVLAPILLYFSVITFFDKRGRLLGRRGAPLPARLLVAGILFILAGYVVGSEIVPIFCSLILITIAVLHTAFVENASRQGRRR